MQEALKYTRIGNNHELPQIEHMFSDAQRYQYPQSFNHSHGQARLLLHTKFPSVF